MDLLLTMAMAMPRVAAVAACLACAMLLPGHALAKEYDHYDFKLVLVPAASPGTGGRLDVGYLDRMRFWCAFDVKRPADGALIAQSRQQLCVIQMPAGKPIALSPDWAVRFAHLRVARA